MVTNGCAKCNYDRLGINKALGDFRKLTAAAAAATTTFVTIRVPFGSRKFWDTFIVHVVNPTGVTGETAHNALPS